MRMGDAMLPRSIIVMWLVAFGTATVAEAQTRPAATRGELLYSTHCIACHASQLHWRDKRLARNWDGLQAEVRRWQNLSGLGWSDDDINEVARYLNARYYRYPAVQPA